MKNEKVPIVDARSRIEINMLAEAELRRVQPTLLKKPGKIDLGLFLEFGGIQKYGFEYAISEFEAGVEGCTDLKGKLLILNENVYNGANDGNARDIFTVFHEYGHVLLHRHLQKRMYEYGSSAVQRAYRRDIPAYINPEWQANELSAGMLMPLSHCMQIIESGGNWIDFCELFGVSTAAAQVRERVVREILDDPKKKAKALVSLSHRDLF
ncbi:ImmA/IrrE family metallo-endopeptidase [Leptospira licerasiae]|uniref:ImmA/IrrE family metallo-endopeptidase n=1 Tax=Leptospira licerasiae TaxID=447106 RepID=UPI0030162436